MSQPDYLLIDRQYLRNMASQLKYAHERINGKPCQCPYCAHGQRMGIPVEELPA